MNLLTRYLLAQFIRHFLTLNVAFVALYMLIDFFEKFDEFAEAGKPMSLILKFFLLNVPFVVDQLSPVLILLSGIITLGVLKSNNELLALKAAGIPLRSILKPILIGSVFATTMFILAAQFLLPKTIETTNNIWYEQVRGKVPLGIFRSGRYYFKGTEGFYSFQWPNKEKMIFKDFSFSTWDERFNVKSMVVANYCDWNDVYIRWECSSGQVIKRDAEGNSVSEPFASQAFLLPESPEDFMVPEYESVEMSLTGLFSRITKKDRPLERTAAKSDFYGRISYLLLGIPLLLLGMPILMLSYQKWGRDLSVAIPISCFIAFIAWGIWGAFQSLAKSGYMLPLPAASSVHLLFSIIGVYLLMKQDN